MADDLIKASKFRTVCEVLREIGDLHNQATPHDEAIRGKLAEAINMCKRMDRALQEDNGRRLSEDGWWVKNPAFKKIEAKRKAAKRARGME
jgi:hypothetical protein